MDLCEMKEPNGTTQESEEPQKHNADHENQVIFELQHWNVEFVKMRKSLLTKATWSMESLTELMQFYVRNIRISVTDCDSKPSEAAKLKDSVTETLILFSYIYRNISGARNEAVYLATMSDILALYLDLELKTSKKSMEDCEAISARITTTFYVYLEHSVEHWLDALIKVQFMYPCYHAILDPVISRIFKIIPRRPESSTMYTRYFLVYCLWRRINVEKMIKHRITAMTASSLGPLPSTFPPYILRNILPKVPNAQPHTAAALMDCKFDLRKCCEIFTRNTDSSLKNLHRANKESLDTIEHSAKHPLQILKPEDRSTIIGEPVNRRNAFKHKLTKSEKSLHSSNAFNVDAKSNFKCSNSCVDVSAKHSNGRLIKLKKHSSRRKRKNHNDIVIIDLTSDVALEKCIKQRKCRKIAWLDEAKKRISITMLKPMTKTVAREHKPSQLSPHRKNGRSSLQDQSPMTNDAGKNTSTEEHPSTIIPNGGSELIQTVDECLTNGTATIEGVHVSEKESGDLSIKESCNPESSKAELSGKLESSETFYPPSNSRTGEGITREIDHEDVNSARKSHQSAEKINVIEYPMNINSLEESGTRTGNDFKRSNPIDLHGSTGLKDVDVTRVNSVISRTSSFDCTEKRSATRKIVSTSLEEHNASKIDNNEFVPLAIYSEDRNRQEKEVIHLDKTKQTYSCTKDTQSNDPVNGTPALARHEQLITGESNVKSRDDVDFAKADKLNVASARVSCYAKDTPAQSYFINNKSKLSRKAKESAYSQGEISEPETKLLDSEVPCASFITLGEESVSAMASSYFNANSPPAQVYYSEKSHARDYAKDPRPKFKPEVISVVESTLASNSVLQNMELRDDIDGLSLLASVSQQVPHLSPLREPNRNHSTRNDCASVHKGSCNVTTESETNVSYNVTFPAVSDISSNDIISNIVGTQSGNVFGKVAVQLEVRSDPVIVENSEYGSRGSVLHCSDTCTNYEGENLSHIPLSESSINTVKDNTNVILNGETVVLLQKSPNSNLYIINKAVENVKESSNDDEAAKLKEKGWSNHHDLGQLDINTVDPLFYESELLQTNKVYSYQEEKLLLGQNRSIKVEPDEISLSNMGELKASVQKMSLVSVASPTQQQAHTLDASALNANTATEKRKSSKSKLVFRQNIKQEFSDVSSHISDSNAQAYNDLHPHRNEIDLQHSRVSVTHSMSTLPPIYGNYSGNTDSCVLCHKRCATVSCNLQINASASLYAHKTNSSSSCARAHCACLNCGYDIVARCRKCISVHSANDSRASCVESNPYFLSTHSSVQTPTVQEHDKSKDDSVLGKFYDDSVYCKVEQNFFRKASADQLEKPREVVSVTERKLDNKLPLKKRLKAHAMMSMVYKEIQIKTESATDCSLVPASSANTYSVAENVHCGGKKLHVPPDSLKSSMANKEAAPLNFTYFNRSSLGSDLETEILPSHQTCQLKAESRNQALSVNDLCAASHMETTVTMSSERKQMYQEIPCKKLKKPQSQLKQTRSSKRNVPKVNYCYTDVDPEWRPSCESKRKRKKANR